jgi:hypothetical protein
MTAANQISRRVVSLHKADWRRIDEARLAVLSALAEDDALSEDEAVEFATLSKLLKVEELLHDCDLGSGTYWFGRTHDVQRHCLEERPDAVRIPYQRSDRRYLFDKDVVGRIGFIREGAEVFHVQ